MSVEGGPGPEFLKEKYDLHNSDEVESAKERTEFRTGEQIPQNPDLLIQNYLDRFKEITDRDDPDKRQRGIEALKKVLHDKFVIQSEEIPEGYYENQQRLAREQGHGNIEITVEMRQQLSEVIIADQESTLDNWIDYLASDDATYPDWLKYFALRSITQMGGFDKERHTFSKRSIGTTKPFPDLNREALAYVLDAVEKKYQGRGVDSLDGEEKKEFEKLLNSENFSKLYAWAIEKVTPASVEQIAITEGKWVKYDKGSDAMPLVQSLQGHGTGWCTAGESTARAQLDAGDFYVYYSHDQQGQPTVPRAAVRMQGDQIGEVRGIAAEQNLDPYIGDIVQEKLQEFPDGKAYEKKNSDMKALTTIDNKIKLNQQLSKDDLIFLYEIEAPIDGFGNRRDPRIEEMKKQREEIKDLAIIFDCLPLEIAKTKEEIIAGRTKVYIGPLFEGIFSRYPRPGLIYTQLGNPPIRIENFEIGTENGQTLNRYLGEQNIDVNNSYQYLIDQDKIKQRKHPKNYKIVKLNVNDLGFTKYPTQTTLEELLKRARSFGLAPLPFDAAIHQRLLDTDQPENTFYYVITESIYKRSPAKRISLGNKEGHLYIENHYGDGVSHDATTIIFGLSSPEKPRNQS